MTGYGRGEVSKSRTSATAEIRTVNSRYLEISLRLPSSLSSREQEIKEIVRAALNRGKINVTLSLTRGKNGQAPLRVNATAAKAYHKALTTLRKSLRLREEVTLDMLLRFPEVLETDGDEELDEAEWALARQALERAVDGTARMRLREGAALGKDLLARLKFIGRKVDEIEKRGASRVPAERDRMRKRLEELLEDRSAVDEKRLEQELAVYADKLDMTEECVRFRSHMEFFRRTLDEDAPGRKLNFLVQEMNREVNTMGSKASDAPIAQTVVVIKEELEKIREQLQNIE